MHVAPIAASASDGIIANSGGAASSGTKMPAVRSIMHDFCPMRERRCVRQPAVLEDASTISAAPTSGIGPDRGSSAAAGARSGSPLAAQIYRFGRDDDVRSFDGLHIVRSEPSASLRLLFGLPGSQKIRRVEVFSETVIHD